MSLILGGSSAQFTDIMRFVTGLDSLPAVGLLPSPTVTFQHRRDLKASKDKLLPKANTCANQLIIIVDERHRRFKRFKEELEMAILCSEGFTSDDLI